MRGGFSSLTPILNDGQINRQGRLLGSQGLRTKMGRAWRSGLFGGGRLLRRSAPRGGTHRRRGKKGPSLTPRRASSKVRWFRMSFPSEARSGVVAARSPQPFCRLRFPTLVTLPASSLSATCRRPAFALICNPPANDFVVGLSGHQTRIHAGSSRRQICPSTPF